MIDDIERSEKEGRGQIAAASTLDEIRQAGARSPQVARRLRASLEDLRASAPGERIHVLDEQIELLEEEVRRVVPEAELAFALEPDRQGIGVCSGEPRGRGQTHRTTTTPARSAPARSLPRRK